MPTKPPRVARQNGKPAKVGLPVVDVAHVTRNLNTLFSEPGFGALALPPGQGPLKLPPRGKPAAPLTGPKESFTLDQFGNKDYPLRPSSLGLLVHCPLRRVIEMMMVSEDSSGPAADTGSLTHAAVTAFHKTKGPADARVQAAMAALSEFADCFPQADRDDARIFASHYVADPRNLHAQVVYCEEPVELTLDPHPADPTGDKIWIMGTLDQVRLEKGNRFRVYDLKTGQPSGPAMLGDHAFQMAAYVLGARQKLNPNIEPGCLIRAMGYRVKAAEKELPSPRGVFWEMPFTVRTANVILDTVRLKVAQIRGGEVEIGPGPHCSYCHTGGLDRCVPLAERTFGLKVS